MLPLWAKARETEKNNPIIFDTFAKKIVESVDYDYTQIQERHMTGRQGVRAIRAYHFDNIIEAFLEDNRGAVIVNIGAGLDTTFQRVDQGDVLWVDIDLPDVVAMRQKFVRHQLIPDSEREMT